MYAIRRAINNLKYAYYKRRGDNAIKRMVEHVDDADITIWRKYAKIGADSLSKCIDISRAIKG